MVINIGMNTNQLELYKARIAEVPKRHKDICQELGISDNEGERIINKLLSTGEVEVENSKSYGMPDYYVRLSSRAIYRQSTKQSTIATKVLKWSYAWLKKYWWTFIIPVIAGLVVEYLKGHLSFMKATIS